MERTGIELLWGTTNLTRNPRYMSGAATNPNPEIFAYAAAQVKKTFDVTHQLGGHNFVLWGGREGYETILNTDMRREMDQLARFLTMIADYKEKIGFKGQLLLEPKPCEPSKHQYDFDSATVYAFLQRYGLENAYKLNIEGNHATLAGHTFSHEIAYAYATQMFGSIDVNAGDMLLGWDTDQFAIDPTEMRYLLYIMLQNGGFSGGGGFNLDTKVRRQSTDLVDLFYAHISGIDTLAKALIEAEAMLKEGQLKSFVEARYSGWDQGEGKEILNGARTIEQVADSVAQKDLRPKPVSGRQEYLERILTDRG
jgi:xylose isomerase